DPYFVTITDANGCTFLFQITVGDDPGPVIDSITTIDIPCFGDNTGSATVYTSEGTWPLTYSWNDPANQSAPTAGNLAAGAYFITVTDFNGCTDDGFVTIDEPDSLEMYISPDPTICYQEDALISVVAVGGGNQPYDYFWDNGLSNSPSHTVMPLVTTVYTVYVVDANLCPSATSLVTVTVTPPLSATLLDVDICIGEDALLSVDVTDGNGGFYNYLWSNGVTTSEQILSGLLSDATFSVTVSDNCSPDVIVDALVTVNPVPNVSFTVTGSGCAPYVFTADTASQGGVPPVPIASWMWYFGDGVTSTEAFTTSHTYTTPDTFDVSLVVVSFDGCKDSTSIPGAAIAFAPPNADFNIMQGENELIPAVTSILSPTIDFENASSTNVSAWDWNFGDPNSGGDNISDLENPSHMYTDTGTYLITLIVTTPEGCEDTITKEVTITGEYIIFAPNSFTPNGDGDNDYFFPKGMGVEDESFELYIYDRWGDLIATVTGAWSDDISIGWDGRANAGNRAAQMDVYIWLIRTSDEMGNDHEYIGHVTLLQ
ncbi:MAG: gliding motility-associated C-terminal domain-containing protein, partial [Flavobacteriales bacterium]|nr:gliding motility-associated C-terminal domain-containing protein [Flavobacteriales bacterium]